MLWRPLHRQSSTNHWYGTACQNPLYDRSMSADEVVTGLPSSYRAIIGQDSHSAGSDRDPGTGVYYVLAILFFGKEVV
jgi:hypothetical protein